jgi:hypothetical protein
MKRMHLILAGLMLILNACNKDIIDGNGQLIEENRDVSSFNSIEVVGDIDIKLTAGDHYSINVRTHSNIMPYLITELEGQTLKVTYDTDTRVVNARSAVVVTMPKLKGLYLVGDATIITSGDFQGEVLELSATGNGKLIVGSGKYEELKCLNTGQCQIKAFDLEVDEAAVSLHGNGNTEVRVHELLKATINGNGKIYYKGNPQLITDINGNGKVIQK